MTQKLTVWYNTKCPVCNAGIDWQHHRLVRAARAGTIDFRDINLEPDALSGFGVGVNDIRRRLHAVDGENRLYAGIDCAIRSGFERPVTSGSGGWSGCRGRSSTKPLKYKISKTTPSRVEWGGFGYRAARKITPLPEFVRV